MTSDGASAGGPRGGVGEERPVVQGVRGEGPVNPRTLGWWKSKLGEAATRRFVEVTSQVAATAEPEDGDGRAGRRPRRACACVGASTPTR
jgi:hypothetical protein